VLAIEAKPASAINDDDVRHLERLRREIGDDLIGAVVITTGPEAYRRKDGIAVVPLSFLGV
jgi:predicted AAA+ superfamily ATPase